MNIEVTITIDAATLRGLIVDSLKRNQTIAERISDMVTEHTPALNHKKAGDFGREALETLPTHIIDDIRQNGAARKLDMTTSLRSFMIQKAREESGIKVMKTQ